MAGSGSAEMTVDGGDWDSEATVRDSGGPEQVFLVLRPLRVGLGLKIGWHYTRQELFERIPTEATDARAGRLQLQAFIDDPEHAYLRPVAGGWGWPSPRDSDDPFHRSPEMLLSMGLVLTHSNWHAHAAHMSEFGHRSDDEAQGSLGGLTCAEANALRQLAQSIADQIIEGSRRYGLEIPDDEHLGLRRAALHVVSALQEDLADAAFARRSQQDELWR